jgi:hypothetical protein
MGGAPFVHIKEKKKHSHANLGTPIYDLKMGQFFQHMHA